ncbi:Acyl-homoserine lactone acylase QuiP [Alphaproteobacteria bacterium SO-S41]|nr:Acyl-homoserine lactone acylase QuiP [Alphaproteobacteria bacterium SO-S41]
MRRIVALLFALFTGSCAALFPREVSTAERLAVFPTAGLPLDQPVTIRWNSYQVPYIDAKTDHDLAFSLGLVHAHLRLAEIALAKRITEGRLSELAGPVMLPDFDKAIRTLDLRHAGPAIIAAMPAETRAYLQAFVDGLNYYQKNVRDLPPEFALLGMRREDFTLEDIVAIGHVAGIDINWFTLIGLLRQRDQPDFEQAFARTMEAGSGPTVSFDATKTSAFFDLLANSIRSGSNSFAVAPSRSASGHAMIANDPHLGVSLPNLWVMAGFSSPSYRGVGMMIPGTPFLAFGRTPDIAWGGTNMRAAHTDFYDVSKLAPDQIVTTDTKVRKRLWFSADVPTRWAKDIGPVMSDTVIMEGATRPGEVVALRWIGHETTDEITAILNASRTKTPQDFRAALKTFALPAQNFIYADASGNIAQMMATMLPRRSFDVLPKTIVLDATDPAMRWQGIVDPTQLPWALNPAEGFLGSANNKPYEAQAGVPVGWFFSADERIRRQRQMLGGDDKITLDELKAMQLDTVSLFVREMMPAIRDAVTEAGGRDLNPVFVDRLIAFDGDYKVDSPGAPAFETFLFYFAPRVYGVASAAEIPSYLANWNGFGKAFVRDMLALPADRRIAAVRDAIALAAPDAAPFPKWGDMHRLQVSHALGAIPVIGGQFTYADLPTGGSRETIFKSAHGFTNAVHATRYGSQARQLSDLGDIDSNWFVLLGGNDGWIGSANFIDQLPLWQSGTYIRMPLRPETIAAEFPTVMELKN